jgi:membrane protein DedA with SNARE-associated domain
VGATALVRAISSILHTQRFKDTLGTLSLPLFAIAAFGLFYIVWALLDLPPKEEVVRLAEIYFDRYGLITVFVCALIESVLFAGWYFPGSLVIVLGVVFAGDDTGQLFGVYAVTTLGFILSYIINFFVGAHGWYRLFMLVGLREPLENAQTQLAQYGTRAIFLTYWHPNLGALTSTAAGILRIPFMQFLRYSIAATIIWNAMWTVVGYAFGEFSVTLIGPKFVVAFIAAWIAVTLGYQAWKRRATILNPIAPENK